MISFIMALVLVFSAFPAYAFDVRVSSEKDDEADGQPFLFTLEPGDLTLKQLRSARLNEADIPDVISPQLAYSREHVNRLYLQEPDDYTVMFQNRDGSKTVYYFSVPVKSGGRDLSSSEFAVLSGETNTSAFRISDNRLAFVRTNERLRRLDGKCTDKKVYYYNLGYADIQSFDTQLTGPGTDITDDVRAMTEMPLNTEREYDLSGISRSGSGSGTGGTGLGPGSSGNLCFSYATSELAGIVRLKNYDTGTYLKNTNGTLSMGTAGSSMSPTVRWSLNYQGSSLYHIRAFYVNQTTQGFLTYNNSLYLLDYCSGYSIWRFDYVSVSGNDYYYIKPVVSSSTALNSSLTCASPAGDAYYWEVNDRRDIITSITAPGKAIAGQDEPLNNLLTISPSNAMRYIVWMNENGTPVGTNVDGEFVLSTPGYYELYYWDYYSNTGNDPEELQPVSVILPATGQEEFSGKYVNISYSSATRKNIAVSSAGSLSVQNPNGQDIYQTLKLTAVDAANMEYTISFYVPEIISNEYTGHLKEVCLNYSGTSLSMAEPTQQNLSTRTWYVLKAGTVYYIIHKNTMKMLRIYGNTLTVTQEWGSNCKWDLFYSGVYAIENKSSNGLYLDITEGYDSTAIPAKVKTFSQNYSTQNLRWKAYNSKQFRITYSYGEGAYMLRPVCSKNGYGLILHVGSNGTVKQDGLLGNNSNNRDRQLFYIEYEDGYYRFVPKFDQQYCIGASSSVSGSSVNAVSRNNNDIFQKWELITAYGNTESMDDPCQIVKQEIYYRSMSLGLPLNISQTDNTLKVTSDFGYRILEVNDQPNDHFGIDFRSITNNNTALNLLSVICGVVHNTTNPSSNPDGGNTITITSTKYKQYTVLSGEGSQLYFYFAHLSSYTANNSVQKGSSIGVTGNSNGHPGSTMAVHLHMSVTTRSQNTGYIADYYQNVDPLMFYDPAVYRAECGLPDDE